MWGKGRKDKAMRMRAINRDRLPITDDRVRTPFPEKLVNAYRREAVRAAKELCYPKKAIDKIMKAKTEKEISKIMENCRKECFA